ncbi:dihydroneopterin aldolase [Alicyclobacillus acidiphilus]|uniref:dihydroneopterin aldolase n=1 Tax=Alicyclobacillus acidiphilus TaxID=182455 RepID=UPI000831AA23|nr:dihydroneopterin aldolase [Alicyclobacillus acidiphilus]
MSEAGDCQANDEISLCGMQFYGYHGALAEERALGQRFVVSVWLRCDLRAAGERDDLNLTVNYAEVYQVVRRIVEGTPKRLLEAVAEDLARHILEHFSPVQSVAVEIQKPGAPIEGVFDSVAVKIKRHRR